MTLFSFEARGLSFVRVGASSKTYKDKVGYSLTSSSWFEPSMSTKLTFLQFTNGVAYVTSSADFIKLVFLQSLV